jgi:proline dehydrogenase
MFLINKFLAWTLPLVPKFIIGFFSKKYIAGPRIEDAIDKIKHFNAKGIMATVDILGEEIKKKENANKVVEQYKEVLKAIETYKLDSNISLKPTHLGLKIDNEFCFNNIKSIVEEAQKYKNFVRIDMEDHTCTSATIDIFLRLKENYDNVGVVIQSYLRRTIDDVNILSKHKANLRLCKGIYIEPRDIVYKDRSIIKENFKYALEKLLSAGCYIGIATHDEELVWHALSQIDKHKLNKNEYEFQMLLGVSEGLRDILVSAGHRMRVYVPYGEHWYAYSMRRLKENPNISRSIIKNMFIRN